VRSCPAKGRDPRCPHTELVKQRGESLVDEYADDLAVALASADRRHGYPLQSGWPPGPAYQEYPTAQGCDEPQATGIQRGLCYEGAQTDVLSASSREATQSRRRARSFLWNWVSGFACGLCAAEHSRILLLDAVASARGRCFIGVLVKRGNHQ